MHNSLITSALMRATHPTAQTKGKRNLVGAAVRNLRLARKPRITQKDLQDKLSMFYAIKLERSAIARIEKGERYVLDYELVALASALGVELDAMVPKKTPKGFESLERR